MSAWFLDSELSTCFLLVLISCSSVMNVSGELVNVVLQS